MTNTLTTDAARLPMLLTQLRLPTIARLWPALTETADREQLLVMHHVFKCGGCTWKHFVQLILP